MHQIKSESGLSFLYVAFELIELESSDEWLKSMEETKQCPEVIMNIKEDKDMMAALIWKSLLIQATKTEQAFFEEMLKKLGLFPYSFVSANFCFPFT
ncbi:hypothetical protein [Bacillus sp. SD075]|uniref:hypothetical protein n=1 Tax=Bacillus sp. SD075 TaxID=2781732 RepID=UPI0025710157|nr:hypothetical protein [Bacillus sp. SD075]